MTRLFYALLLAALPFSAGAQTQAQADQPPPLAATLDAIRSAGRLDCGTVQSADDWNGQDIHGNLSRLGGEICRAIAVAIFGTADKLTIHAYPAEPEALSALKSGEIPLAVGISPAATTAVQYGVGFGPAVFYDAQRIMVSKQSGITSLAGLRDKLICALDMTQPEQTLRDVMTAKGIPYGLQAHSEQGEMDAAVAVARCVGTGMESRQAQTRANLHPLLSAILFQPALMGPPRKTEIR